MWISTRFGRVSQNGAESGLVSRPADATPAKPQATTTTTAKHQIVGKCKNFWAFDFPAMLFSSDALKWCISPVLQADGRLRGRSYFEGFLHTSSKTRRDLYYHGLGALLTLSCHLWYSVEI